MQCRQCGKVLREDEGICPACGAVQAQLHEASPSLGVPVATYVPSRQGPPIAYDVDALPAGQSALSAPLDAPKTLRRRGYQPVVLPPAPSDRSASRRRLSRPALAVLALFAVLGLAAGLVARGGNVPVPGLAAIRARPTATATAAPACPAVRVAHTTSPALGSLQLTTGLQHDYRPVNNVSRFTVGATGYVTFKVLSSQAGTVNALICTPGRLISGHPVQVPKGSAGLYVEYPLSLGSADVGQGMVTISWDGSVAANQEFTVVSCSSPVAVQTACG